MTFLLALLAAVPPPALEVTIPNPKRSLPELARFLDALGHVDDRLRSKNFTSATGGLVDPFAADALLELGLDSSQPLFLIRAEPRGRHMLFATVRPKVWDKSIAGAKSLDLSVVDGHVVIGAKRRWQTLLRRDGSNLYAMRATSALGFKSVDPGRLVKREAAPMVDLARHRPRGWRTPRGVPKNRDVYVKANAIDGITSMVAAIALDGDGAKIDLRLVLDAIEGIALKDLVAGRPARALLAPAETAPTIEVLANIPREGRRWLAVQAGLPSSFADAASGPVQIALTRDGHLAIAFEATSANQASTIVEAVKTRFPKSAVDRVTRHVLVQLGGTHRRFAAKPPAPIPSGLRVEVVPPDVFRALARRAAAGDGAGLDTTHLAVVRFAYGPVMRAGRRVTLDLTRARNAFVGHVELVY